MIEHGDMPKYLWADYDARVYAAAEKSGFKKKKECDDCAYRFIVCESIRRCQRESNKFYDDKHSVEIKKPDDEIQFSQEIKDLDLPEKEETQTKEYRYKLNGGVESGIDPRVLYIAFDILSNMSSAEINKPNGSDITYQMVHGTPFSWVLELGSLYVTMKGEDTEWLKPVFTDIRLFNKGHTLTVVVNSAISDFIKEEIVAQLYEELSEAADPTGLVTNIGEDNKGE